MLRLELVDLTKHYADVKANDAVSLRVAPGDIHAVLGENGAGKSTLVKMIYGAVRPDAGEMHWNGAPVAIRNPQAARALGIAMVFQHFSLFDTLTAAENVWLGLDPSSSLAEVTARIVEVAASYGLPVEPQRPVHTLSVGERQRVEIVRALMTKPQLLILDEPTSVLTPQAVQTLFATLRQLSSEGCSILYISHKLDEIRALCDHCTVLRGGRVVGTVDNPRAETNASLARLMIGVELPRLQRHAAQRGAEVTQGRLEGAPGTTPDRVSDGRSSDLGHATPHATLDAVLGASMVSTPDAILDVGPGTTPDVDSNADLDTVRNRARGPARDAVLEVRGLTLAKDDPFGTSLGDVGFDVCAGEIVGVAGVSGNGQQELLAALSGEDRRAPPGSIRLFGRDISADSPGRRRAQGLHFVPEERLGRAAVPTLSLAQNTLLTRTEAVGRAGWIAPAVAAALAQSLIRRFNVKASGPAAAADSLSGGNLQKFIVGREIDAEPKLLIVAQPTWGVDVGAAAQIRAELLALRDRGCALLVVSEELDELFEICDRLVVIAQGRVSPSVATSAATVETIGAWMSGLWTSDSSPSGSSANGSSAKESQEGERTDASA